MGSRYSSMEHLVRSVLFSRYKESVLVAMFSAYFDESGTRGERALAVCGFVSTVKKWSRFEIEWNGILKSEGVEEPFHMTDFVSSQRDFSGWKGQSERRRLFVRRLVGCVKKNVNKFFYAVLVIEDYEAVNKTFYLEEVIGRPYAVCGKQCLNMVRKWAARKRITAPVLCYFEDGAKDKGNFEEWAKRMGEKPLFLPKAMGIPFQAADLAAWKYRAAIHKTLEPDHTPEKGIELFKSVVELHAIPHAGGVWDRVSLAEWCSQTTIPRRKQKPGRAGT